MNDFTKENLETLSILINSSLRTDLMDKENYSKKEIIYTKIQSMIDNYCEHEEEYEDFNYQPMRCKKCLEITG